MSEELLYDRTQNFSGVSLISEFDYTPIYGSSVNFESSNSVFNTNDNYFQMLPKGINNLKAKYNLIYKTDEDGVRKLANYYESSRGDRMVPIISDPNIYKITSGYCTDYSVTYVNNQNYEFKVSLEVVEASSVINWKSMEFLSFDAPEWKWNYSYQKDDVVFFKSNDMGINNFFYCTRDHVSSADNSPISENSNWTQDFKWEPDLNSSIQVKLDVDKNDSSTLTTFTKVKKNTAVFPINYSFSNISTKQLIAMLHFLENKCGYRRFAHKPPKVFNRPKVYICESWSHSFVYDDCHNLSVSFKEDPLGVVPRKSTLDLDETKLSKVLTTAYNSNNEPIYMGLEKPNSIEGDIPPSYFSNYSDISRVEIGNSASYIPYRAFSDCPNLTGELTIPNNIKYISDWAFGGLISEETNPKIKGSLYIPDSVEWIGKYAFLKNDFGGTLTFGSNSKLDFIDESAFYGCGFTGVLITPDSLNSIGSNSFRETKIQFLDLNNGLEKIWPAAFKDCVDLVGELIIPDTVDYMGNQAFIRCSGLEYIELSSGCPVIPQGCFEKCYNVQEVDIPTGVLTLDQNCFGNMNSVLEFILPEGLEEIGTYSFNKCRGMTGITIPESVVSIGNSGFLDTSSLESFYINSPSSVFQGIDAFQRTYTGLKIYVGADYLSSYTTNWRTAQKVPNEAEILEWI